MQQCRLESVPCIAARPVAVLAEKAQASGNEELHATSGLPVQCLVLSLRDGISHGKLHCAILKISSVLWLRTVCCAARRGSKRQRLYALHVCWQGCLYSATGKGTKAHMEAGQIDMSRWRWATQPASAVLKSGEMLFACRYSRSASVGSNGGGGSQFVRRSANQLDLHIGTQLPVPHQNYLTTPRPWALD